MSDLPGSLLPPATYFPPPLSFLKPSPGPAADVHEGLALVCQPAPGSRSSFHPKRKKLSLWKLELDLRKSQLYLDWANFFATASIAITSYFKNEWPTWITVASCYLLPSPSILLGAIARSSSRCSWRSCPGPWWTLQSKIRWYIDVFRGAKRSRIFNKKSTRTKKSNTLESWGLGEKQLNVPKIQK